MRGRVTQVTRKAGSQLEIRKEDGEPGYGLSQYRLLISEWSASLLPAYITFLHPYSTHFDHEDGHSMFLCNDGMNPKDYMVSTKMTAL